MTGNLSVSTYMPCYHIDLSAKKAAFGKYNYTETLQKQAEQAEKGLDTEVGTQKLTQQEIKALSETYNPRNMSREEYRDLIHELEAKGVLSEREAFDLIGSCVTVTPGAHGCLEAASPRLSHPFSSIQSLGDAGGNAIYWLSVLASQRSGGAQTRAEACGKVSGILEQMEWYRSTERTDL